MEFVDMKVRVVLCHHKSNGHVVAQCLEHDVAAHGDSVPQALEALRYVMSGYLAIAKETETEPFADLGPAPDQFHNMFKQLLAEKKVMSGVRLRLGIVPKQQLNGGCKNHAVTCEEHHGAEAELAFAEV